jgi:Uma2 family endonuclease
VAVSAVPAIPTDTREGEKIDEDRTTFNRRVDKFAQYREAGVAHYWIIDPALRTIETWKLEGGQYVPVGPGQGPAFVNFAPFPDLQIPLVKLWRE